jgi:hypothetical protein
MDKTKIDLHPEVNPPEVRATFLAVKRSERNRLAQTLQRSSTPESVKGFLYKLGVRDKIAEEGGNKSGGD